MIDKEDRKILIPEKKFEFLKDDRLLIPFSYKGRIGFLNSNSREEVVYPQYSKYCGECYTEEDYIIVAKEYKCIVNEEEYTVDPCFKYGLINYKGQELISVDNLSITPVADNSRLFLVVNNKSQYSLVYVGWGGYKYYNWRYREFYVSNYVNPGIYKSIDPFKNDLSRVSKEVIEDGHRVIRYGIINTRGQVVKNITFPYIEKFYDNDNDYIDFIYPGFADDETYYERISIEEIKRNFEGAEKRKADTHTIHETYSLLNDGLDGEVGAYWNID